MAPRSIAAVFVVALCALASAGAAARPMSRDASELPAEATFLPTYPNPWDKPYQNEKPLIGILTQACHYCPGRSYVAGAFVKWVEAAGGRPVPIRFYASDAELFRLFKSVNGLIFPGGLTDLWMDDPYVVAARKLWTWAREANDAGRLFPIHGTCLGFQLLHLLEANLSYVDALVPTDSVAYPSALDFDVPDADPSAPELPWATSTLFGNVSRRLVAALSSPADSIALENHMFGLPPSRYEEIPALGANWRMLNTAVDRKNVSYVATAEHRRYPFTATQWHPEKPPFEFGMKVIPHSLDAVAVSQALANAVVDVARRSPHVPESHEEEIAMLIYNYKPYFTLKDSVMDPSYDGPDMCFFFDDPHTEPDNVSIERAIRQVAQAKRSIRASNNAANGPVLLATPAPQTAEPLPPASSRMSTSFRGVSAIPAGRGVADM